MISMGCEISRAGVEEARNRIAGHVRRTPSIRVAAADLGLDLTGEIVLKLELLQCAGSFKPRGAFNRILSAGRPPRVLAASGGNHGVAVAYAARALEIEAEIFVPEIVSPVKLARLRALGASVQVVGRDYQDALDASQVRARETGALVVHAYDQPEVLLGAGTVGLELMDDAPDLDTVLVATGGGGLVGGIATAYAGAARVVSVEPTRSCALSRALREGRPVEVEVGGIAKDSLGARRVGDLAFAVCVQHGVTAVEIPDESIAEAQRQLSAALGLIAEPGGATALAALVSGAYAPREGERVGVVVCGCNADPASAVFGR